REAVELYRVLAEASPAAYTPDLAMSLNNLANILSAVGERNEALEAAREAVRLRRALAEASPAAYTPLLAASLNNLANRLSAVGERNEALEAVREAVELYRVLAEDSPAAYTPLLAASLNTLANILSAVGERNEALEAFVEGFDCFSPAVRARLLVARATWRHDGGEAGDVVAAAREADSTDDPVFLGPVRRMIARVITDAGISDTGLPRWVTVDAESATSSIEGWLECEDSEQRGAFLEAQWSSPSASEREALAALAELYVDRPSVAALAALVERIADEGIQAVATDLRAHHRARLLARDWREAHLNGRGASFLREYTRGNPDASRNEGQISEGGKQESEEWEKDLGDPDMRTRVPQVLAAMLPEAEAASMASVLALAELTDPRTAYDAHGSDEGAEDTLRDLLEAHNWLAMVTVLGVRPSVAESTYGRIALLLFAAVTDEPVERLRELYEHANEAMDAIDRRHLQALLDQALRTRQCPATFADILTWIKHSNSQTR
ncbi:tetratricopeptide repeat protein, partial [uncultured Actinomyces sp.]|uniref:tetratricopeptide repeat protein n=1 Tax=uncultured Actinomyces sp. TaxID=249061 RepID=UPI00261B6FD5